MESTCARCALQQASCLTPQTERAESSKSSALTLHRCLTRLLSEAFAIWIVAATIQSVHNLRDPQAARTKDVRYKFKRFKHACRAHAEGRTTRKSPRSTATVTRAFISLICDTGSEVNSQKPKFSLPVLAASVSLCWNFAWSMAAAAATKARLAAHVPAEVVHGVADRPLSWSLSTRAQVKVDDTLRTLESRQCCSWHSGGLPTAELGGYCYSRSQPAPDSLH